MTVADYVNTQSIRANRVKYGEMERQGDFTFDEDFRHIYVWLPGQMSPDCLRINRGAPDGDKVWGWDGNEIFPTLQPSILIIGQWHGYLDSGQFRSC